MAWEMAAKSLRIVWIAITYLESYTCEQFTANSLKIRSHRRIILRKFPAILSILALFLLVPSLLAHEARPAYLEIKETAPNQFSVLWRTPVLAGMRLPVVLQLPDDVKNLRDPEVQELADSFVERRWIDAGPKGLAGKRIEFPGLQLTITDVLVRIEMLDGRKWTTIVHPSQAWVEVAAAQTTWGVVGTYKASGTFSLAPITCCSCWGCC